MLVDKYFVTSTAALRQPIEEEGGKGVEVTAAKRLRTNKQLRIGAKRLYRLCWVLFFYIPSPSGALIVDTYAELYTPAAVAAGEHKSC
jgi:hypothetical protein